jgi:predicted lipoprotein with Yx(FWY)xxD motif
MRITTLAAGILAVAIVAAGAYRYMQQSPAGGSGEKIALATPPGITLQNAKFGMTDSGFAGYKAPLLKPVYADAKGMTLYTFDKDVEPGKSACASDCAKAWPALVASANAQPTGAWSVITRDDGSKQWAFKGKPLYTFAKDAKLGDAEGNGADSVWHAAMYQPAEGAVLPDGVALQELLNAGGEVFVSDQGTPLYTFDGDAKGGKPSCIAEPCSTQWAPFVAAQLAKPVGDFTVVHRDDGIYQWAYKGRPLYSFSGDVVAGDAKADGLEGKWHVATMLRQFTPPGVAIWHNKFGGDNLATADGRTLYIRDRVIGTNTGHNLRAGIHGNPMVGRMLGTTSCDAECAKTWHPLAAPADAQPSGYWEVATRDDGTKQWSYRGFPVYTFAGDEKPGDMKGNDTYDIFQGTDPFAMADIGIKGAGAMVWHAAIP